MTLEDTGKYSIERRMIVGALSHGISAKQIQALNVREQLLFKDCQREILV